MNHIFISHVAEDRAIAEQLRQALTVASYPTWTYSDQSVAGASYVDQIVSVAERRW